MKQALTFGTSFDNDHLSFDYCGEIELFEDRIFKASGKPFSVDLSEIDLPLRLKNSSGLEYKDDKIGIVLTFPADKKVLLSSTFAFTHFAVPDVRRAYILARRVARAVEEAMILAVPTAPFYGMSQNFNFRVDVPKPILGLDASRRSLVIRNR